MPPLKILCVDDEPSVLDVLRILLNSGGHRVETASGPIQVEGVVGPIDVRSASGDISVSGALHDPSMVRTVSGDIRVRLMPGSQSEPTLETTSGQIDLQPVRTPGLGEV